MNTSQSILATLAYHDIFDYPLSADEIHRYLIGKKFSPFHIKSELNKLTASSKIDRKQGLYYLKNRSKLVRIRLSRENYSKSKLKKALFYASLLKIIPTIKLAAVSGALAMENSRKNDDIDILIVASRGQIWTTRFLANLILFPYKRNPHGKKTKDKACLNLFLEESSLGIKNQNLYIAHEIFQIRPIWGRQGTYQKFIYANSWVKKYLPNWKPDDSTMYRISGIKKSNFPFIPSRLSLLEILLKKFQLWYMKSKISTERIGDKQLFFHPANTQEKVLTEYRKRLKKLNLTT